MLGELAKLPGPAADLPALLAKACDRLSPDWRPPVTAPDGLVLLRRIPTRAAGSRNGGPALTPSMMKAMVDQAALTIHVVDLKRWQQSTAVCRQVLDMEAMARIQVQSSGPTYVRRQPPFCVQYEVISRSR